MDSTFLRVVIALYALFLPPYRCLAKQYASKSSQRCIPELSVLWSRELSLSPYAAAPLITDVDADGDLDILAVSFLGDVHAIHAKDGRDIEEGRWSARIPHSSVLSSPLQYDIDGDGLLDTVIISTDGQIWFLNARGMFMETESFQIDGLYVQKDWHLRILSADDTSIHDFILDEPSGDLDGTYITVDPHVLASPVIADFNQDGVKEEMAIPVSYFYDRREYELPGKDLPFHLTWDDLPNYLASSLLILNLTSMEPIKTIHLELTKMTSAFPGFLLYSPSVADLDKNSSSLELVIGSSAGQLHVINVITGRNIEGFPIPGDTIFGQILVEDVNNDGELELVAQDASGKIMCYSTSGRLLWDAGVDMTKPSGARVADINGDDQLEVILSSDKGEVHVLSGVTGEELPNWPFKLVDGAQSPPLLMPLPSMAPALVVLGNDGYLNVISADRSTCRDTVNLAETSLVPILSHDLVPEARGMEMLIATRDGTLLCLGSSANLTLPNSGASLMPQAVLYAWPSENKALSDSAYYGSKVGLRLLSPLMAVRQVSGRQFSLSFEFINQISSTSSDQSFQIRVYFGHQLLLQESYSRPGTYQLQIPCPEQPMHGHLIMEAVTRHSKVYSLQIPMQFHATALLDLRWLVLGPTIGMSFLLLFLHGFPAADLLPISSSRKRT